MQFIKAKRPSLFCRILYCCTVTVLFSYFELDKRVQVAATRKRTRTPHFSASCESSTGLAEHSTIVLWCAVSDIHALAKFIVYQSRCCKGT